jgi:hypothetical protein
VEAARSEIPVEGQPPGPSRWKAGLTEVAAAFALPLLLYVVLRPESYGLAPNWFDPAFYTGYAVNFDDVLNAAGDTHYFISRWSGYYPNYLFDIVAGPTAGRLLLRLCLAAAVLLSLWSLRRNWSWGQRILVGVVALSLPMFARSFFTDYPEYVVVSVGVCAVCLALRERQTVVTGLALGVLTGLMVVANPYAATVMAFPLLAALVFGARGWRGRVSLVALVGAGALFTLATGLLWFRWRYGISNVYQPTIDFVRNQQGVRDPLKSPRLDWLGRFTWLYSVPLLIVAYVGIALVRRIRLLRIEWTALGICAAQYSYQWFDQFVRDADGLEISYYWSFVLPSTLVVLALALGRCTERVRLPALLVGSAAWCAFLLVGVPDGLRLPAGIPLALVLLVAVAAVVAVARWRTWAAVVLMVVLIGWTQIGAPSYDPTAYFAYNMSPAYDQMYGSAPTTSEVTFDEMLWFARQMDTVGDDATASFAPTSALAGTVVAIYGAQVSGHMLAIGPDGAPTSAQVQSIVDGATPLAVVYGPPQTVEPVVDALRSAVPTMSVELDLTNPEGLGYRLVVLRSPVG